MRFALVGQPNCGKSTLFNQVAGYKAETGNFAGTTVSYTESKVRVMGEVVELVDLPGTYTLSGSNPAEQETIRYLSSHQVDVIINVVDASHLSSGLNLTLEVLELQRPTVVALNMMDEAARMGMAIDGKKLSESLNAPVLPLIASKGRGVRNVFTTALLLGRSRETPSRPTYGTEIEQAIKQLVESINGRSVLPMQPEALAIRLLEGNPLLTQILEQRKPGLAPVVQSAQIQISQTLGENPGWVISISRRNLATQIADSVIQYGQRKISWQDRLDDILLHPFWGYITLGIILIGFFQAIYGLGNALEKPLLDLFDLFITQTDIYLLRLPLISQVFSGVLHGIAGGVAIVLPYLVPFLLGLGFLEDIGYLPRIAFLMDALMHRIGLHGKAIVPFILGYGCNVPAVMSTRLLEDRRDRYLAAALATMVPCAARLAVVFGLVAFYLGPLIAFGIYVFNLFVIALAGRVIAAMMPEDTPGLILEMPVYRLPTLRTIVQKAWFRIREFVFEAWPILIVGSIILSILNYLNLARLLNALVSPVTWLLGLPSEVGVPLIFGILRKELSLIMLRQALGVTDFSLALTNVQMITFTVFVVFYIPCLATMAVLKRELGKRDMLTIVGITVLIALLSAIIARGMAILIY